jgi:hypothetical protein
VPVRPKEARKPRFQGRNVDPRLSHSASPAGRRSLRIGLRQRFTDAPRAPSTVRGVSRASYGADFNQLGFDHLLVSHRNF